MILYYIMQYNIVCFKIWMYYVIWCCIIYCYDIVLFDQIHNHNMVQYCIILYQNILIRCHIICYNISLYIFCCSIAFYHMIDTSYDTIVYSVIECNIVFNILSVLINILSYNTVWNKQMIVKQFLFRMTYDIVSKHTTYPRFFISQDKGGLIKLMPHKSNASSRWAL